MGGENSRYYGMRLACSLFKQFQSLPFKYSLLLLCAATQALSRLHVGPTQDARERPSSIRTRFSDAFDARTSCLSVALSGSRRNASIAARSRFDYL